ncbi:MULTISPECIES: hypothetical protein [unclassified Streptomyces]|uniref:hypothetical protein n=1 Tax=unclassified Streptomyces TaxID=2593676 RepID=UPI0034043547
MPGDAVTGHLGGDVMLGRGVDQILPHPGDPALRESYVHDARAHVGLAEEANGHIPRPVPFRRSWGVALPELAGRQLGHPVPGRREPSRAVTVEDGSVTSYEAIGDPVRLRRLSPAVLDA